MPDHYATLDLKPDASAAEIKKAFYTLSKAHHPDLHPSDPSASKKFVAISEAYNVLGTPSSKQTYDRNFLRAAPSSRPPSGSYSSATTGPGGRPASGLSRRRSTFRGPPPSFYAQGGWGAHSAKRSQHAPDPSSHESSSSHASQQTSGGAPGGPGGTGPGGFAAGLNNDVPHFDQAGHYATQEKVEKVRHRGRRRVERRGGAEGEVDWEGATGGSPLFNFVMVSGALGVIFAVTGVVMGGEAKGRRVREKE